MAEYNSYAEKAPVHLSIKFNDADEARELFRELHTWTPSGGWSQSAAEFFSALEEAAMHD